jgi:hypothetical protein
MFFKRTKCDIEGVVNIANINNLFSSDYNKLNPCLYIYLIFHLFYHI